MSLSRILANIGTALDSATTGDFLSKVDSDGVFGGVAYSSVTGTPTVLDSANITNLVDSAYIQLRQSAVSGGGLDSATTISFVDSDYITSRATASGFQMFEYDATAGQTEFTGSDVNGNTLAYSEYGLLVHYNGILLSGATDYTATDGTTVVLTDSADADARITIAKWSLASAGGGGSSFVNGGDRAVQHLGYTTANSNILEYFDITTPSNSSDFGDLTWTERNYVRGSISDTTYGIYPGRRNTTDIDYITFATIANATDFGDLTVATCYQFTGLSNGTKGLIGHHLVLENSAFVQPGYIDQIIIATSGNATDFGYTATSLRDLNGSLSDGTYGVWVGGRTTSSVSDSTNQINYLTIDTPSNSSDFGDLTVVTSFGSCAANSTYGLSMGGQNGTTSPLDVIDYFVIATPGNATDFGDLLSGGNRASAATSNSTRAVYSGGSTSNVIQYVDYATPGNATDFGDLSANSRDCYAASGSPS